MTIAAANASARRRNAFRSSSGANTESGITYADVQRTMKTGTNGTRQTGSERSSIGARRGRQRAGAEDEL